MSRSRPVALTVVAVLCLAASGCGVAGQSVASASLPDAPGTSSAPTTTTPGEGEGSISTADAAVVLQGAIARARAATSVHVKGEMMSPSYQAWRVDMAGLISGTNQRAVVKGWQTDLDVITAGGQHLHADHRRRTRQERGGAGGGGPAAGGTAPAEVRVSAPMQQAVEVLTSVLAAEPQYRLIEGNAQGFKALMLIPSIGGKDTEIVVTERSFDLLGIKREGMNLTFSDWNAVKPVAAPAAAEVFTK